MPKEIVPRIVELQIEDPAGFAVIATKLQKEMNIQADHRKEVALVPSRVDCNQIRHPVRGLVKGQASDYTVNALFELVDWLTVSVKASTHTCFLVVMR